MLFLLKPRCTTCILLLFLQILTKSTMLFKRQIRIKNKYFGSSFTGRFQYGRIVVYVSDSKFHIAALTNTKKISGTT